MSSKNYYRILELQETASAEEIKKAYRQLALKYHPDKNNGDRIAEYHFKEIQEAYHTLSDHQRRTAYNQKRWYSRHSLKRKAPEPLTGFIIFTKCNELILYLNQLRPSEINKKPLYHYIRHLLNEDAMSVLRRTNDPSINKEILLRLLQASEPLSPMEKEQITRRLKQIADRETLPVIERRLKEVSKAKRWEQYQFLVILAITIVLCIIIYIAGS